MKTTQNQTQPYVAVNFSYNGERDLNLNYAYLPAMPRIGDKINYPKSPVKYYRIVDLFFYVPENNGDQVCDVEAILEAGPQKDPEPKTENIDSPEESA